MEPSCLGSLIIMEDPFLHDFGALGRAVKTLLGEGSCTLKYTYLQYTDVFPTMAAAHKTKEVEVQIMRFGPASYSDMN